MIIQADENFDAILRETFSSFELDVQINGIPVIFCNYTMAHLSLIDCR